MEKILIVPHPKLRQKSDDIRVVTDEEINISKKMMELVKKAPGVGLAANQIGYEYRAFVMKGANKEQSMFFINH